MASNGSAGSFTTQNVLEAIGTLRGGDADKKKIAMDYLGKFQKSVPIPPPFHFPRFLLKQRRLLT
jgi:hypothetical protein